MSLVFPIPELSTIYPGEGGTYALFQGLFPPKHNDFDDDRTLTGDSLKRESNSSSKLSPKLWWPLLMMVRRADAFFCPAFPHSPP